VRDIVSRVRLREAPLALQAPAHRELFLGRGTRLLQTTALVTRE
jgi:hypothetical protein